jgi:beta-glucosidase
MMKYMTSLFPKNFLWGAATAAHQVEGNNHNQWSVWEDKNATRLASRAEKEIGSFDSWEEVKNEAKTPSNYRSGRASGSYELFSKDFDLIEALNMNSYRFSIEWSRIEPNENEWNQQSIDHYRVMLEELKSRNIEPIITLFHFTLPVWFAEKGGFEKRKNVKYFTRFTEKIVSELGEYARYFITINEPEVYSSISYIAKMWPPAKRNLYKAVKVQINLATAHNAAAKVVHRLNPTYSVSVAKHSIYFYSEKNTWLNRFIINALQYVMDDFFMKKVINECDFIGINYYQSMCINGFIVRSPKIQKNDLNWAMQPKDIKGVLVRFHKKYHKPIMVTENGLADGLDNRRKWWIEETLDAMESAISLGVELKGYFHWSLIDNFEWSYGKWPHFGLASVDQNTLERTLRPSARWYGERIEKYRE